MVQTNPSKKKSTFLLSEGILSEMKEVISARGIRSQNALVEEALRDYISRFKRELRRRQYLEASKDPLFLSDIQDIEKAFKGADAETAGMLR